MFPEALAKRITLLALAAGLLMGLGRVAALPPFDDFDETAHYSRIEAAAFAEPGVNSSFLSTDVVDYARHGPMTPWWIRTQAILPAFNEAVDSGKPLKFDLAARLRQQGYKDFRAFFASPETNDYARLYREQPGPRGYTASAEGNWEFQHPALYYLVMGRVLRLVADAPLLQRLLVLRAFSFLMAFAGFALGLFATFRHLELRKNADARAITALGAFYPFVLPVFFPEFARLGNDSLCLLLFSAVWALMLWHLRRPRETALWFLLGLAMGYTWFAKAFMIPITFGLLAFMALQAAAGPAASGKSKLVRLFLRLRPALAAGATAVAVGIWPYAPGHGHTPGSIEMTGFLHGTGFLGGGTPWLQIFLNPVYLLVSAVYNITDIKASYAPWAFIAIAILALAVVFGRWLLSLPRNPRREEWLPLYALLPLAGGLVVHCVFSAIAYRTVGTTPGHYFHIEAPALALMFGAGLLNCARWRAGRFLPHVVLAFAAVGTITTMALRLALFTGCAWLSDNFVNLHIDLDGAACQPGVFYDRLALLSWPAAGLPCMAAGFLLFATAVFMALARPGASAIQRPAARKHRKSR